MPLVPNRDPNLSRNSDCNRNTNSKSKPDHKPQNDTNLYNQNLTPDTNSNP